MPDQTTIIALIFRLLSVGTLLSSAELLAHRDLLKADGLMGWETGRLRQAWLVRGAMGRCLNALLRYPNVLGILLLRMLLSTLVIFAPSPLILSPWVVLPSTALCWLVVLRASYGQDGADQMAYILYTGLSVATLAGIRECGVVFLWFVALQSCLSYLVAGIAKATSRGWRDGTYLLGICDTQIYGNMGVARFLRRRQGLAQMVGLSLIAWECCFGALLILPKSVALGLLVSGILFHLSNGYLMGLNTFIWSFTSTYPAIFYCLLRYLHRP